MKYVRYFIAWLGLMPFVFVGALQTLRVFLSVEVAVFVTSIFYIVFILVINNIIEEDIKSGAGQ